MKHRSVLSLTRWMLAGSLALGCTAQLEDAEDIDVSRSPLAYAKATEFVATHDVVVKQATPTTNYNVTLLCSQYDANSYPDWTVLKFNTTGLVAPFSRATLRVALSPNGNTLENFRIYNSTNTSWTEAITWDTKPVPGTSYVTVPAGSVGSSFFDIDVTSLINTASNYQTLIIRPVATTDTDALCLYDQSSAGVTLGETHKPRLVFDYYGSVPTADAHVDAANTATNFGAATTLPLNSSASETRAYLQFPVSRPMLNALRNIQLHGASISNGLPSPRGRVMLRLYPTASVSGTSAVVYAPNSGTNWTTWSETGLTWDNQPAGAAAPAATAIATIANTVAGRWVEVDVTQAVTHTIAWANTLSTTPQDLSINLLLAGGSGTFASKEDATYKPMLVFISSELPTAANDGICSKGEDCASNPTECGACATGANRGGYLPTWGDLHRHGLADGQDGWTDTQVETHTQNVLTYLKNTEKMEFVALTEHEYIKPWSTAGFARQMTAVSNMTQNGRFVPTMGTETYIGNRAKEIHMKFDISGKAGTTYSAVKLRVKPVNASTGQFKIRRHIRCNGKNADGTLNLSSAWYTMSQPTWSNRWERIWDEKKDLFSGNLTVGAWADIDVSELLLQNGALYTTMSADCGLPDPDNLSNVVLAITVGTMATDAFGISSRDDQAGINAPRLVFFVNGVEQAGPVSTNADQRFETGTTSTGAQASWPSTETTFAVEILNQTAGGDFPMGHNNLLFPPSSINLTTYAWTSGTVTRKWTDGKLSNRVFYDYLDDTTNVWLGQVNHPHNADPLVDPTVVPSAVARMATYELSGSGPVKWSDTTYYTNSWQERLNRYLGFVRQGWRVAPAANTDGHCSCNTSPCDIVAHNCPNTMTSNRTGLWVTGRSYTELKESLAEKRAFAVQGGTSFEDKQFYIAMHASQSSTFDTNWWMGSVMPNRSPWTLTVFAKNFNDTGTLKVRSITLHDDDGYGAIATLQCGDSASCSGSVDYTPAAANKAVIAVAELTDGRYIVSAPVFF
ncbi:DUF7594 domain-containing protein [Archangium sp.]|uniref:CBM96 family carbohydrate-binding protein n=1 Tax=Archangium sp. TaxID=1872627 RepID=UPI002D3D0BCD|nr:DNRLRE domain-containing protein [Archangium sp.]HYO52883.1 DNRLRE domain-containing protein [Archangium sp.]